MVVVVDRLRTGEMKKKKIRKGEQVTKMLDLFCEKHRIGKQLCRICKMPDWNTNYEHEQKKKQIYLYRKRYAKKKIHNATYTSSDMRG